MSKRVSVVDDFSSLRTAVRITLEESGFSVTEAEHGEDGLKNLREKR